MEFESLAWRYDDLFSRSRIGTQRGTVWEVLADIFRPGDAILVLNCRTGKTRSFLHCWTSPLLRRDAAEESRLQQLSFAPAELFDGALANFSGLNSIADFHQTARDLACLVTMGAPRHRLPFYPVLPFRNALVSRPWQISQRFPQILWDRYRESRRSGRENTLPGLEGSEEVVFTIFSHALLHGDRCSDSAFVSGTGLP